MVDGAVLAGSKEEVQRARHLLHQRLSKWLQDLSGIVIRQPALLLRQPRLLQRQAVATLDFLGQLPTAEQLFAGVDNPPVVQHAQGGHGGADVHHCDRQRFLGNRESTGQKFE
ncbi:hypothetical protein D9M73_157950 [compost metagenome]